VHGHGVLVADWQSMGYATGSLRTNPGPIPGSPIGATRETILFGATAFALYIHTPLWDGVRSMGVSRPRIVRRRLDTVTSAMSIRFGVSQSGVSISGMS
jgi:hypothetical protein